MLNETLHHVAQYTAWFVGVVCVGVLVSGAVFLLRFAYYVWRSWKYERAVALRILSLHRRGELYGRELVKLSDGVLSPGTIYIVLDSLEREGLVQSREEDETPDEIGIPRRLYRLTLAARLVLEKPNE